MAGKKAVRRRERRRMTRAEAQLSMRVEGGGTDGALVPIVTESRNISGSGVYCDSPHYLAPLSKVALTIVLPPEPGRTPSQRLLKCEGVVVRCQPGDGPGRDRAYQVACSFLDLEDGARARLERYVVWRNLQALRGGGQTPAKRRAGTRRVKSTPAARRAAKPRRATPRKRRVVH